MTGTYEFARQGGRVVCICKDTGRKGWGNTQAEAQADCEHNKLGLPQALTMVELMNVVVPADCGPCSGHPIGQSDIHELDKIRDKGFLPQPFRDHLNQYLTHPDIAHRLHANETRPTDPEELTGPRGS